MGEKGWSNKSNLIPITSETAKELGRKGGKVRSRNKSIRTKLIWLRRKGLTDENSKHLYEVLSDPDISALDIRMYLEKIKTKATTTRDMNATVNNLINLHKLQHGEKKSIDVRSVNVNVNIEKEISEIDDYLKTILGEDD